VHKLEVREGVVWSVVRIRAQIGSAGGSGMVSGEDTCTRAGSV
jgi:hypothetical protein